MAVLVVDGNGRLMWTIDGMATTDGKAEGGFLLLVLEEEQLLVSFGNCEIKNGLEQLSMRELDGFLAV
jgi:hypothetical protein